jgi:hypothetical protein
LVLVSCWRLFYLFFNWFAVAAYKLIVATGTFFPIASYVVEMPRQRTAIMASWRISDENPVMILSWRRRLVAPFAPIWNWIKFTIDCLDRHTLAAFSSVHF